MSGHFFVRPFDVDGDESGADSDFCFKDHDQDDMEWETVPVDEYSHTKAQDAMQCVDSLCVWHRTLEGR